MKNKYSMLFWLLVISLKVCAQGIRVNDTWIIVENGKLFESSIGDIRFILTDKNGTTEIIPIEYIPGAVYVNDSDDFKKVRYDSLKKLSISFDCQYKNIIGKKRYKAYTIGLSHEYLKYSFILLKVKDLHSFLFFRTRGEKYGYQLRFPGYSISSLSRKKWHD